MSTTRGLANAKLMAANLRRNFDTTRGAKKINVKGHHNRQGELTSTGIVATNQLAAVPIDKQDRRTAVLGTRLLGVGDQTLKAFYAWFSDAKGMPRAEAVEAIRHWLATRGISKHFDPYGRAPRFVTRDKVLDAIKGDVDRALDAVLADAHGPFFYEPDLRGLVRAQLKATLGAEDLSAALKDFDQRVGYAMRDANVKRLETAQVADTKANEKHLRLRPKPRPHDATPREKMPKVPVLVAWDLVTGGPGDVITMARVAEVAELNRRQF
jgi:hypothetical protein